MTSPGRDSPRTIAPLAVVAALALIAIGFYPLPLLMPNHAGIARQNLHYWVGAGVLTLGPVLALAAMPFAWLRALPDRAVRLLRRPPPIVFALLVGLLFAGLCVGLAYYAYRFAPITEDEIAQLWHARILLHGRLSLPADPNFEFFAVDNVIDRGAWLSQYPIGGPLVLTLGYLMHAPWLLDPLLGAFTVMALYHFARRAFGETQGRAVAALFTLAPLTLLMSASYMNHVPVLFLTVGTLALLAEWDRATTTLRRLLIAAGMGLAVGFMATIRPLDAVVVAAGVGVFQLTVLRREPQRWRDLLVEIVLGAVGVAPLLYANWATTGGMFHFAYEVMWGPAHRLGFHVDPQGQAYTPLAAAARAARYVNELNTFVVQWPVPALLVAVAGLISMRRVTRWDALLLGLFGAQLLAYALYWHDGQFLGPRFLYTVVPVVIVLLARAPFLIADRWGGYWRHAAPLGVLACIAVAWRSPWGRTAPSAWCARCTAAATASRSISRRPPARRGRAPRPGAGPRTVQCAPHAATLGDRVHAHGRRPGVRARRRLFRALGGAVWPRRTRRSRRASAPGSRPSGSPPTRRAPLPSMRSIPPSTSRRSSRSRRNARRRSPPMRSTAAFRSVSDSCSSPSGRQAT